MLFHVSDHRRPSRLLHCEITIATVLEVLLMALVVSTLYVKLFTPNTISLDMDESMPTSAWKVQGDTMPLSSAGVQLQDATWMDAMAVLNLRYAKSHGYEYTRFLYPTTTSGIHTICSHPTFDNRHVAWLLVVAKILAEYALPSDVEYVVWLDSDAIVQQQHLTIPDMIDIFPSGCGQYNVCNNSTCLAHRREAALLVAANIPFCGEPCLTAIQIWNRRHNKHLSILKRWWNSNQCAHEFPWEQRAFNKDVYPYHLHDHIGGIGILNADINHPHKQESELLQQVFRHIGHSDANQRLPQAHNVARYMELTDEEFVSLHADLVESHSTLLNPSELDDLARSLTDASAASDFSECEYVPIKSTGNLSTALLTELDLRCRLISPVRYTIFEHHPSTCTL